MYQIKCDDYILHDTRIDELKVISPKCELEINKTGSLTFQVLPTHPYYDKIHKHTSEITLYQDDAILFMGRVLNDEITFNNIKVIECEGELSYLLDSIQRGKEYHMGDSTGTIFPNVIESYLEDMIAIHNSQVDDRKKFNLGIVTVKAPLNSLHKISNYENTLSVVNDKLISIYGGHLQVRHSNGERYLDYFADFVNMCSQRIEFGKNIIDMTKYIKGEDIYTAMIPLGKVTETPESNSYNQLEKRLTLSSIADRTDGNIKKVGDYIYDTEAVARWGWIWSVKKWDDENDAESLYSNAKANLQASIDESLSLELTAVDLHLLNVDVDRIKLCDKIQCISLPHNLNTILVVKAMSIDIDNPSNTTIKLASPTQTIKSELSISSGNKDNEKNITEVKDVLDESYPSYEDLNVKFDGFSTQFDTKIDNLKDWADNRFLPQGADGSVDLTGYARITEVNSAFSQLASALQEV